MWLSCPHCDIQFDDQNAQFRESKACPACQMPLTAPPNDQSCNYVQGKERIGSDSWKQLCQTAAAAWRYRRSVVAALIFGTLMLLGVVFFGSCLDQTMEK